MGVLNAIIPQSDNINQGTSMNLNKKHEIGAGDQGIMYGFACDETPELLPLPYVLVNRMMRAFETCGDPDFAPDGKGQVSVEYERQYLQYLQARPPRQGADVQCHRLPERQQDR